VDSLVLSIPALTASPEPSDCAKTFPPCLKKFNPIKGIADYLQRIIGFP